MNRCSACCKSINMNVNKDKETIDLVYLLGTGTTWGNNEIKYSIRSVEKFLSGYNRIFIIGNKPYFFNDQIIEIPFKDLYKNKARNIMSKILRASNDERISDDFFLFNDDYFLLQPFSCINYPYYYKCELTHSVNIQIGEYEKHCRATMELLKNQGLGILNFDTHKPILYNKSLFKKMVNQYNWDVPYGYIVKSMYCNHYNLPGVLEKDCKISHPYTVQQIQALNNGRQMFSTGDNAINAAMQKYLKELFPNKSKYEL